MKSKDGRQYCDFCRRWLDGDSYWVDIPKNLYFCDAACAAHAQSYSAECVNVPKAPKPESAPTQQPLEVPDIYLAELVGVMRRALQADGLTERLWAILDDWCDNQERYLEKKYPEAHEQAKARDSVTVDWRANAYYSPELGAYQRASDELMERFPRWLIPESRPFGKRDSAIIDEMLEGAGLDIPESPPVDDPDVAKNLAMRLGSYPTRRNYEVSEPTARSPFVVSVDGVEVNASHRDRSGQGRDGVADRLRVRVSGVDDTCTCQAFQGDNPQCAFHGEGTAWHDLHGGE